MMKVDRWIFYFRGTVPTLSGEGNGNPTPVVAALEGIPGARGSLVGCRDGC